ncbi:MAG: hypothetical protein IJO49_02090, partial [Clostridia bacterium]|nr:hypothetical protein [Clostridia bacterium]
ENIILTQEDLQNALLDLGYNVTQSTVSRDIKELNLLKVTIMMEIIAMLLILSIWMITLLNTICL